MAGARRWGTTLVLALAAACGDAPASQSTGLPPVDAPDPDPNAHPLAQAGMPFHPGDTPPDVTGQYLADSMVITFDSSYGEGAPRDDYMFTWANQTAQNSVETSWEDLEGPDSASGLRGIIEGSGNCFTIHIDQKGEVPGCSYRTELLYSGCLANAGIGEFHLGLLMRAKEGDGCDSLVPVGHGRIIEETDGLLSRQD